MTSGAEGRFERRHQRLAGGVNNVQTNHDGETGNGVEFGAAWARYPSIEAASAGASAHMREDRVLRVLVGTE